MTLEQLERIKAEELRKAKELKKYNQLNYMQWLRNIKPKWTEDQVFNSASKHFGKSFLLVKEENTEDDLFLVFEDEGKIVDLNKMNHSELNGIIEKYELEVDTKLKKEDKIKAIFSATKTEGE